MMWSWFMLYTVLLGYVNRLVLVWQVEDWLYEEETTAAEYKKRLDSLKAIGDSMFLRSLYIVLEPSSFVSL